MAAIENKLTAEQAKENVVNATKELQDKILTEIYDSVDNASKKALSQLNYVISGQNAATPHLVDNIVTALQNDQYTVDKNTEETRVTLNIKWPEDE